MAIRTHNRKPWYPGKPGPKPGQRHSGQFKPGQTGNPSGFNGLQRMKSKAIEELAREHAAEAVAALVDLLHNGSDSARRAAAEALLDRAYGKPVDRQAVLNIGTGSDQAGELTRAQLLRIAGQAIELQAVSAGDRDDPPPPSI